MEISGALILQSEIQCWMMFMRMAPGNPGRRCTVWVQRVCYWVPSCYGPMMPSRQLELMGGFSWNQKHRRIILGVEVCFLGWDVWLFLRRLKVKNLFITVNWGIFICGIYIYIYNICWYWSAYIYSRWFFHFSSCLLWTVHQECRMLSAFSPLRGFAWCRATCSRRPCMDLHLWCCLKTFQRRLSKRERDWSVWWRIKQPEKQCEWKMCVALSCLLLRKVIEVVWSWA